MNATAQKIEILTHTSSIKSVMGTTLSEVVDAKGETCGYISDMGDGIFRAMLSIGFPGCDDVHRFTSLKAAWDFVEAAMLARNA